MGIQAINQHNASTSTPIKIYTPSATLPVLSSSGICIQADPQNATNIYIGTAGMVKGTTSALRQKVLAILAPGAFWPPSDFGGVDPDFLYLAVDTAGDGVNVSIVG